MEPEAKEFKLSLSGEDEALVAGPGAAALCFVTSAACRFNSAVRERIKFAVTRKGKEVKERVTNRQDLFNFSEDQKRFQFGFDLAEPGVYKVVVFYSSQNIAGSPLKISVPGGSGEKPGVAGDSKVALVPALRELAISTAPSPKPAATGPQSTPSISVDSTRSVLVKAGGGLLVSVEQKPSACVQPKPRCPKTEAAPPAAGPVKTLRRPTIRVAAPSSPGLVDLVTLTGAVSRPFPSLASIKEGVQEGDLHKPIGLCVLGNGNLVVASTFENKVKMYLPSGGLASVLSDPGRPFVRPSDMVALADGNFVVRDSRGILLYSPVGAFLRQLAGWREDPKARSYGLAEDASGRLVTIMEHGGRPAALVFLNIAEDRVVHRRDLGDAVGQAGAGSKCRFLAHYSGRLYVTDLGLDRVYVLDSGTGQILTVFGKTGKGPDCFSDPAGLGVDGVGNMLVADSRNHRICLYSREGRFVSTLSLAPPVKRPSGLLLDRDRAELYVLNLAGRLAMVKYRLQ